VFKMAGNDRASTCPFRGSFSTVKGQKLKNYTAQHKLGVKVVYRIIYDLSTIFV